MMVRNLVSVLLPKERASVAPLTLLSASQIRTHKYVIPAISQSRYQDCSSKLYTAPIVLGGIDYEVLTFWRV